MTLPYWIDFLERKFGFIKIPNLGIVLAIIQGIGWYFCTKDSSLIAKLALNPTAVLHGELYRLFSFLLIPLSDGILMFLYLWFVIFVLRILERKWGSFKLTLYFILGWLGAVLGAFIFNTPLDSFMLLESTFFFALATLMPDFNLLLFFILPLKMKWIGIAFAAILVLQLVLFGAWQMVLCLVFSCLNYIIFFGPGICKGFVAELKKRRT